MKLPNPIFSNNEYVNNKDFKIWLKKSKEIIDSDVPREQKNEWLAVITYDMNKQAHFWLKIFKRAEWWREGLE